MAKLKTGRHTSALKMSRRAEHRLFRNQAVMSRIKSHARKFLQAPSPENLSLAFSLLDKAAKRGIIHPRTASRKKSRWARKLKMFLAPAKPQTQKT